MNCCLVFLFTLFSISAIRAGPNVLVIITDDQGYGDLSIHGNPHLKTPHIDRLGQKGVRFDRFFVNSFCAPTRAALLTGRWPLRCGVHGVTHNKETMKSSEVTLAEVLRPKGYRTACIGKWHNGEQFPFIPSGQGFEHVFGFNNGHWNNYFDATLLRDSKPEKTRGYITDVLTDEAISFISNVQKETFFCYLAYNAPHSPYQVQDTYFAKFKAKGFEDNVAAFYGMCENLDDNIGRLMAHLDQLHLTENTLVIFLTDNGGTAGVPIYNAGMRGGKTSMHEGGNRVPLFVHWPAAKWTPHEVKEITAHIDLFPTLLDLCEIEMPPLKLDGKSLRPLLENKGEWQERILFTHNPINETNKYPGAVRTQRHRLVREIKGAGGGSKAKANDAAIKPWQLYDMEDDPGQQHDIAKKHPEIVATLSAAYDDWFADISFKGLKRFPLPVGHSAQNPVELHAPQAFYDKPLVFANGPGFANDWLTSWSDIKAKVRYEIDVVTAGEYEIKIAYAAASETLLKVRHKEDSLEVILPAAEAAEIPLPHRDEEGRARYRDRLWKHHRIGNLKLPRGQTVLNLECLSMPGIDLKHIELTLR